MAKSFDPNQDPTYAGFQPWAQDYATDLGNLNSQATQEIGAIQAQGGDFDTMVAAIKKRQAKLVKDTGALQLKHANRLAAHTNALYPTQIESGVAAAGPTPAQLESAGRQINAVHNRLMGDGYGPYNPAPATTLGNPSAVYPGGAGQQGAPRRTRAWTPQQAAVTPAGVASGTDWLTQATTARAPVGPGSVTPGPGIGGGTWTPNQPKPNPQQARISAELGNNALVANSSEGLTPPRVDNARQFAIGQEALANAGRPAPETVDVAYQNWKSHRAPITSAPPTSDRNYFKEVQANSLREGAEYNAFRDRFFAGQQRRQRMPKVRTQHFDPGKPDDGS